jgi:hypothetical protein
MRDEGEEVLSSPTQLGDLRPHAGNAASLVSLGASMDERISAFGGKGRPTPEESERRRQEFIRLVAAGKPFDEAARDSRIQPMRALAILSHPDVRPLLARAA